MKFLWSALLFLACLPSNAREPVPEIYSEMGVFQNKGMDKRNKFLFAPYFNLEFSDNPTAVYFLNTNIGYAASDFWELYLNIVPFFLTQKRNSHDYVDPFFFGPDADPAIRGGDARIKFSKPQYQIGGEILWAFGYGKDLFFSTKNLQRSDTFFKFGAAGISYDNGEWGYKGHFGLGKTFFMNKWLGLRMTASYNLVQAWFEDEQELRQLFIVELGSVFYI